MNFQNIPLWKLAVISIIRSSARNLIRKPITEEVSVMLKRHNDWVVEPPGGFTHCDLKLQYAVVDKLSVAYKSKQPALFL